MARKNTARTPAKKNGARRRAPTPNPTAGPRCWGVRRYHAKAPLGPDPNAAITKQNYRILIEWDPEIMSAAEAKAMVKAHGAQQFEIADTTKRLVVFQPTWEPASNSDTITKAVLVRLATAQPVLEDDDDDNENSDEHSDDNNDKNNEHGDNGNDGSVGK